MKIVLISEIFGADNKGTSVYVNEVSKKLSSKKKNKIWLFVPKFSKKPNFYIDEFGRNIYQIDHKSHSDFLLKLELLLDNFLINNKVDLIHCLYGHYFHFLKKYNKKIVWTCHNLPPAENKPIFFSNNILFKFINKIYFFLILVKHLFLIRNLYCNTIIVPSSSVFNNLNKYQNFIKKKIKIIGHGYDKISFSKKSYKKKKNYKLLTLSSFKYHKNLLEIPNIIKNIDHINLQWTIIGDKIQKKYFQIFMKKIKKLNLEKKIIVIKKISEDKKINFFKNSDLYVQLSHSEGFCIPILEARMNGLNVVSSNCGAAKEIFLDLNGSLASSQDTVIFSKLIVKNLLKEQKVNKFKLKNWTWNIKIKKLITLYNEL